MIVRSFVVRQARQSLWSPCPRCLRSLTTSIGQPPDHATQLKDAALSAQLRTNDEIHSGTRAAGLNRPPIPAELVDQLPQIAGGVASARKKKKLSQNARRKLRRHEEMLMRAQRRKSHALAATYGTVLERQPYWHPDSAIKTPPAAQDVTLELLLAAQSHLGHATSRWNPLNQKYIFGVREGVHIISLEQTAAYLRRAARVVQGVAYHGGIILFAGQAKHAPALAKAATSSHQYFVHTPWNPGTLTNSRQMLGRLGMRVLGPTDRPVAGYEQKMMDFSKPQPDLVVTINTPMQWILLNECGVNNIPTIGVVDTDVNPTWVTYPIPANDDSLQCMNLIIGVLGRAAELGRLQRLRAAGAGLVTWDSKQQIGMPELKRQLTAEERAADEERHRAYANRALTAEEQERQAKLPAAWRKYKSIADIDIHMRPVGGATTEPDDYAEFARFKAIVESQGVAGLNLDDPSRNMLGDDLNMPPRMQARLRVMKERRAQGIIDDDIAVFGEEDEDDDEDYDDDDDDEDEEEEARKHVKRPVQKYRQRGG